MPKSDFYSFRKSLDDFIPSGRLIDDELRRFAYGTDASFYRLTPRLVIQIVSSDEMSALLKLANRHNVACTFRAAGTSLSGQAVTDSVLVMLSNDWRDAEALNEGRTIRLAPGTIGSSANAVLASYGYRIGPDPASIDTAKIGGIAANNSSGMCCGTTHNAYQTLRSMKLILADGSCLDTGNDMSRDLFRHSHPTLLSHLERWRRELENNKPLNEKIRQKYRLKNTTGYGINALLDYEDPIDILQHLMIGSEGTLGFIAEITLSTVPIQKHIATGLLFFKSVEGACSAVTDLAAETVSAVELIDNKGLAAVAGQPGMPRVDFGQSSTITALLIEVAGDSKEQLNERQQRLKALSQDWQLERPAEFTPDELKAKRLWAIRKGLFPAIGAARRTDETVIIEDVAFPVEQLAKGVNALQDLLIKHGYHETVLFGHALEGNLHFVFTQSFEDQEEIDRYALFMDELADLVAVRFRGSLKAEHGTGRNMAPFVEREWGSDAYSLMRDIKTLLDPQGILNPGVVISDDPKAHVKQLKPLHRTDPLVDHCIECGFCEPACPSLELTLSPRQRIATWREVHRLSMQKEAASRKLSKRLKLAYKYQGTDSCAACGLCELRCPVGINTGDLTKAQRAQTNGRWIWLAEWIAKHYGAVLKLARAGLKAIDKIALLTGRRRVSNIAAVLHRYSWGRIPLWFTSVSAGKNPRHGIYSSKPILDTVIYFPACPGRLMDSNLTEVFVELLNRAGYRVIIPPKVDDHCCGMPFSSKGFDNVSINKRRELTAFLETATKDKRIPVVCDASPCSQQLDGLQNSHIEIIDSIDFIYRQVLPRLSLKKLPRTIAVHATCSDQRRGAAERLVEIAKSCAQEVVVPKNVTCCGFAGDKGFTLPELNASALSSLKSEISGVCTQGYSSSRTCEIGLSEHSGIPYQHVAFLVLEASAPRPPEK
jgi:D-lactate dehydrogenase